MKGKTPDGPHGPFVMPGNYEAIISTNGTSVRKPFVVRIDPRVQISEEDLQLQYQLSKRCYDAYHKLEDAKDEISRHRTIKDYILEFRGEGKPAPSDVLYGSVYEKPDDEETMVGVQSKLLSMIDLLQGADARPTDQLPASPAVFL